MIDSLFISRLAEPRLTEPAPAELSLDEPSLVAGFGGNRQLLREVIDVFLVDSRALLTAIRRAADAREPVALAASVHALKGSVGLFTQRGAYRAAQRLEQMLKSGDLAGAVEASAALETEMADLHASLMELRAKR